ncbi:MAG: nitroreductase family protein [Planctomycetota bacterium]|jgi:nitroreductase
MSTAPTDSPDPRFIPYQAYVPDASPEAASRRFWEILDGRRSVRTFSDRPVSRETIENIIRTAGTAPSGANKQPWRFAAVQDPDIKREIREAAEVEEREFYERRASDAWLRDLRAVGTDEHKPFLETAPWLIVIFKLMKDDNPASVSDQVYYVNESVGIAAGMLIAAVHLAGLVTLTHTPSPMKFLSRILKRPEYERPFLLLPVGYPADDCVVPDLQRKPLNEIMVVDR